VKLALLALLLASAPAWAQSKRYPPEPVDKDKETAAKSNLWERATNPHRSPYQDAVDEAKALLDQRTDDAANEAVKKLDAAVALMPQEPRAFLLRGKAQEQLKQWGKCAADYLAASNHPGELTAGEKHDLPLWLGQCQARAGKLADAERTLGEAAASGASGGDVWMRLGEVRIAMGKLEEAIASLEAASDMADAQTALVRWLLAGAYDRARRPAEAAASATRALQQDRAASLLENPPLPFLGAGEQDYLRGVAYAAFDPPKPELVLAFFRRFLKTAPESPWRKRAEDHLRELKAAPLPDSVERRSGNAALDLAVATTIVRKAMPGMRACLAKYPGLVLKVEMTRVGPRSTGTPVARARIFAPPEGVTIEPERDLDGLSRGDKDTAIRCAQPVAERIVLPAIKEKDAYYRIGFLIVAP